MTAKELRERLAVLRKERKALFATMTDGYKEEDVKAYEDKAKDIHDTEYALTEAERIELDDKLEEGTARTIIEGSKEKLTDEVKLFVRKIQDAVAVGTTYTGIIPSTVASEIIKKRETYGKLRGRCRRISLGGDYTIAIDKDQVTAEYVGEGEKHPEKDASLDQVNFTAYKLGALVKVSEEFIADVAIDALSWLTENIARAFAKKEDTEILKGTGSGNKHMTGILTAVSTNAITAASATAITLDEIKRLVGSMKDYATGAVLIMNPATKTEISLLKDDNGQYYFPPQIDLTSIQGKEIITLDDVDEMAAGARAVIAANLSYYQIVDRQGMKLTVLNELYAESDQKGIKGTERLDGNVLRADAFKVLKMAAA
ncbi:phage major capsid protein [Sphaerochaeta sp. PS]|uniref:phage major capsid protein n=1 Tax=Sphaerochaeta sp. PS TaxID=3076336 RepID=UPI0028A45395|nr:phage major capsid protein [Sphaerochaeta sp. PS]MDT4761825.1 phage major capsid protein [Sphaerochaeta sp. PS]